MNVTCNSTPCTIVLKSQCVYYEGASLVNSGILTNDTLKTALEKIDAALVSSGAVFPIDDFIIDGVTTRTASQNAIYDALLLKQNNISLTTIGDSGSSTFITNVLNIPTYTLSGLGGQPALNGTGFVKISGTTISYDNSVYALDSNVLHTTGAESFTGFKSSTNVSGTPAGILLTNSDGTFSAVLGVTNNNTSQPGASFVTNSIGAAAYFIMAGNNNGAIGIDILSATTGNANSFPIRYTLGVSGVYAYLKRDGEFMANNFKNRLGSFTVSGSGVTTAFSFVKTGGLASEFLKADGSVTTLSNPVSGTGSSGQVTFWDGTSSQTGSNDLFWDNTNKRLGIKNPTPQVSLDVVGKMKIVSGTSSDVVSESNSIALFKGDLRSIVIGQFDSTYDDLPYLQGLVGNSQSDIFINPTGGNVALGGVIPTEKLDVVGNIKASGNITTASFIKIGGVATEYLMADGSVTTISNIGTGLITQTITNGVTDKAPSSDAVFDALALKLNRTGPDTFTGQLTVDSGNVDDSGLTLSKLPQTTYIGNLVSTLPSGNTYEAHVVGADTYFFGLGQVIKMTANIASNWSINIGSAYATDRDDVTGEWYYHNSNTIRKLSADGTTTTNIAAVTAGTDVIGIYFDQNNTIYAVNQMGLVRSITLAGVVNNAFGSFNGPGNCIGLMDGGDGHLYTVTGNQIRKISIATQVVTVVATIDNGSSCVILHQGYFYIGNNSSVARVKLDGTDVDLSYITGLILPFRSRSSMCFINNVLHAVDVFSFNSLTPTNAKVLKTDSTGKVVKTTYLEDTQYALPSDVTNILTQTITDGDTTHAPSGDAVFNALALKESLVNKNADSGYAGLSGRSIVAKGLGIVQNLIAPPLNSTPRTWSLPDKSGTVALTSDLVDANIPATQVSTVPSAVYLTGDDAQEQFDLTELNLIGGFKVSKINLKDLYQTGLIRSDVDVSVLSTPTPNTLLITQVDRVLFSNLIQIDTPTNKISDVVKDFGDVTFTFNGTNSPVANNSRDTYYVGIYSTGAQVYRTEKVYDQDVCYLARLLITNNAGVYTYANLKYYPDLAYNNPLDKGRTVSVVGNFKYSNAGSISFRNEGVIYKKDGINYSNNKQDPNYLVVPDTATNTAQPFIYLIPNINNIATPITATTVIDPKAWYLANGTIGGTNVSNPSYQVYQVAVTVAGAITIQTIASTSNSPQAGVNAIFSNKDDAVAGLTTVVFPPVLPAGDSIVLGTFYLRAGTNTNGSQMLVADDFYFRPVSSSSSSSSVGTSDHTLLSNKNSEASFQHATSTQISSWDALVIAVDGGVF